MTSLTLILISVGLIEIAGFIIALCTLTGILKSFQKEQDEFKANTLDNLSDYLQLAKRTDKSSQEIFDVISQQNNLICEQYQTLISQYKLMSEVFKTQEDRYTTICDHYSKLLNAWKNVEERYSDCYEQLKIQSESISQLKETMDKIGLFEEQKVEGVRPE